VILTLISGLVYVLGTGIVWVNQQKVITAIGT
jgi:hypothetical protein